MPVNVIFDRGQALSTINGLLKDDYVTQEITDAVNKSTVFLSRLGSQKTTHGRQYIFPVQLGLSQGHGARAENAQLPDAGFGEYEQASGTVVYLYSQMYITGQSIEATAGSKAAFADVLKQALRDVREGHKVDVQRQVWGDGTGIIGRVASAVADSTTVPVTDPFGLTYAGTLDNSQKTRLFKRKMQIFIDSSTPVATTVTGVNSDGTITVASPITVDEGSAIYRGDATDLARVNKDKEIHGITAIVSDTGTYLNIDRTGKPEWQANLVDAAGALSEEKMRIALDEALVNGNAQPDLMITDVVTRRRYEALLQSFKRFTNPMQLEGGFTALEFDGRPLVVDKDAPPERIWFLHTPDITWYIMGAANGKFMDRDGAVLDRVPGRDAYQATYYKYADLACKRPANQTVLFGITS